ncbi:MAG: magnesium transporter CorA family protein [Actinomycetia bacterium]|nr:magnesium transporter CorA family protein [Actinomycetes bacterium]
MVRRSDTATSVPSLRDPGAVPIPAGDDPSCRPGSLRSAIWRGGRLTSDRLDRLPGSLKAVPGELVWLDLCRPTQAQLDHLAALGLDPHSLEDTTAPRERPKTSRYADYSFSTVYAIALDPQGTPRLRLSRISAYALDSYLITLREDDAFDMTPVVQRWAEDENLVRFGVDGLLHGLLDVVVDQHFDVMQSLDDESETLVDALFADKPSLDALQRQTFTVRRELVLLRRVVPPMRDVVATLIRDGQGRRKWPVSLISYYEDLDDHVLRASEWCDALRDLLANIFESSLALNDKQMNEAMKKVGGVAAIIAVPTLITGWYGQNIPYWGFSTTAGFISSGVLVVIGVVGLYILFRRKNWL